MYTHFATFAVFRPLQHIFAYSQIRLCGMWAVNIWMRHTDTQQQQHQRTNVKFVLDGRSPIKSCVCTMITCIMAPVRAMRLWFVHWSFYTFSHTCIQPNLAIKFARESNSSCETWPTNQTKHHIHARMEYVLAKLARVIFRNNVNFEFVLFSLSKKCTNGRAIWLKKTWSSLHSHNAPHPQFTWKTYTYKIYFQQRNRIYFVFLLLFFIFFFVSVICNFIFSPNASEWNKEFIPHKIEASAR